MAIKKITVEWTNGDAVTFNDENGVAAEKLKGIKDSLTAEINAAKPQKQVKA